MEASRKTCKQFLTYKSDYTSWRRGRTKANWFVALENPSMRVLFLRFAILQTLIEQFEQVCAPGLIAYPERLEIKPSSCAHSCAPSGSDRLPVSLMSIELDSWFFQVKQRFKSE